VHKRSSTLSPVLYHKTILPQLKSTPIKTNFFFQLKIPQLKRKNQLSLGHYKLKVVHKKIIQWQSIVTQILGAMLKVWTTKKVRKDTPILMVSNRSQLQAENEAIRNGFIDYEPSQTWLGLSKSFKNTGYGLALAAMPIITPVPIQDVQLFDYSVAHKSVNASYGLQANNDDTYVIGNDPYTSDQQRSRDQYEIDNDNWNEVVFEELNGSSTCKLAMHNDWIQSKGYVTDGIVNLNLPEQGISGPFKITSIKHIIPQKKPESDPGEGYEYKPVTGLFIHHSDQVHNITFSNNETIGVTAPHPIFSTTHNDWRLAGELEVGEKVLTYHGEATVTNTEKKAGSEAVYNLEVKDLHNFLVGDVGIVVHNLCYDFIKKRFQLNTKPGKSITGYHPEPGTKRKLKKQDESSLQSKADKDGKQLQRDQDGDLIVCYDDFGFPDFTDYIPKIEGVNGQFDGVFNIGSMTGDNYKDFKSALDMMKSQLPANSPLISINPNNVPFEIDGVSYTFHHHQDCKSMVLVPSSVNGSKYGGAPHVGGASMSQALNQEDIDLFKAELDPSKTGNYKSKCK
jgi:hypothetical protein